MSIQKISAQTETSGDRSPQPAEGKRAATGGNTIRRCFSAAARRGQMPRLLVGACGIPHPDKVQRGGEDSFFIHAGEEMSAVGVADGVGGWASRGVDAGLYARGLMSHCYDHFHDQKPHLRTEEDFSASPMKALAYAHQNTTVLGSSTALVAVLQGQSQSEDAATLYTANLGDSGFVLLRDGDVIFESQPQTHGFNFPLQLQHGGSDKPEMADASGHSVQIGDILVMGTDGLFDNLFTKDIVAMERAMQPAAETVETTVLGLNVTELAQALARRAHELAADEQYLSPFAMEARTAGYKREAGGKMDDITVLVAAVVPSAGTDSAATLVSSARRGTLDHFRPLKIKRQQKQKQPPSRL